MSFKTPRFTVRRFETHDETALYEAAIESIADVYPFLPWCHPEYSIDDSRAFLLSVHGQWAEQCSFAFLIEDPASGRLLGGAGLNKIDEHPVANLGYWIRSSEAGRGIATEVTRGLAGFGFDYLKLIRIEIMMSTQNVASRQVAIKVGASLEGKLRNRLNLHDQNHDAWMYSLTPEDMMQINPTATSEI